MATRQELERALVEADKSGDTQAALLFANMLKEGRFGPSDAAGVQPSAEVAVSQPAQETAVAQPSRQISRFDAVANSLSGGPLGVLNPLKDITSSVIRGTSFSDARKAREGFSRAAAEQYPIETAVSEIGVDSALGAARLPLMAATAIRNSPYIAGILSAALGEELRRGEALIGGAAAAVLPPAVKAVAAGVGSLSKAVQESFKKVAPSLMRQVGSTPNVQVADGFSKISEAVKFAPAVVRDLFAPVDLSNARSVRKIADLIGDDADRIAAEVESYQAANKGAVPALIDIVNPSTARSLREAVERGGEEPLNVLEALATARQNTLASETSSAIQTAGSPTSSGLQKSRSETTDRAMKAIEKQSVIFSVKQKTQLAKKGLFSKNSEARRVVAAIKPKLIDGKEMVRLTVRQVDDLRQDLNKIVNSTAQPPADRRIAKDIVNTILAVTRRQVPQYGKVIRDFEAASKRIKGVEAGQAAVNQRTDYLNDVIELGRNANFLQGARAGIRNGIAARAGESATAAESVAIALREDGGLVSRINIIFGPDEGSAIVAQLREATEPTLRTAGNLRAIERRVKSQTNNFVGRVLTSLADLSVAGVPGSSPVSKAFSVRRLVAGASGLIRDFGLTPKDSLTVAQDLFDPAKTTEALDRLRKAGVNEGELLTLSSAIAAPSVIRASQEPEQPRENAGGQ